MKKLGLIGGLGPESTISYYHDLVYGVQNRLGGQVFPELTVESVDVFRVLRLCGEENYDELEAYLSAAIRRLAAAGAQFAAISANTPHLIFDRLAAASPIPLVSIVAVTRDEALRRGFSRVGLLGTAFTMNGAFFREPFTRQGIQVVLPSETEQALLADRIANELEMGIIRDETRAEFVKIIGRMHREDGIEAVVLGCTELPLLLNDTVSPVPCLDTVQIHVKALVDGIIGA